MKLTKSQLDQIIKEELATVINEVIPITPAIHPLGARLMHHPSKPGSGVVALPGKGKVEDDAEDEAEDDSSSVGSDLGAMSDIDVHNQLVAPAHSTEAEMAYYSLLDEASIRQLRYLIEQELNNIEEQ